MFSISKSVISYSRSMEFTLRPALTQNVTLAKQKQNDFTLIAKVLF